MKHVEPVKLFDRPIAICANHTLASHAASYSCSARTERRTKALARKAYVQRGVLMSLISV
jgi:hypothetical protein